MKKTMKYLLALSGVLSGIHVHAETPTKAPTQSVEEKHPNHFYFGPEFLGYQLNTHVNDIKVHGTRFFWGLRIGYEYLKPNAIYAGISLLGASSENDFKASKSGSPISWRRADKGFGNLEIRLGYTLAPTHWTATPFLAFGTYNVYTIDHHNKQGFKEALPYIAAGIRSQYALNPTFSLGLNLKLFRTTHADQSFKYCGRKATTHHNMWGGEWSIPLVWCVGSTKRWDIQLEPYFLKLAFSEVQNIYGTRLIFSYRF